MTSQDVFLINAGVGLAIFLLFMVRRGQREPTRLNLRARGSNIKDLAAGSEGQHVVSLQAVAAQALHPNEKSLNILFNYNAHTWDAYEILGVPAGAPPKMVEEAYRKAVAQVSPSSQEFISSAYQAIRSHHPRWEP